MRAEDAAAEALALILATLPGSTKPADQLLHEFFRAHPALGRRDRAQVGDWVFDVLRNLRRYRQVATATDTATAREGTTAQATARDLIAVARAAGNLPAGSPAGGPAGSSEPSDAIRYSLPDWLWERLQHAHGERAGAIAESLLNIAPIDLRVNLLRGKAAALRAKLAEHGIQAAPVEGVPTALRIEGRPRLEALDLFERGWFEIQDAGSQRIVDVCDARRGQLVIDFCAGAGGKTLALAARMRNAGKILAFDTGEERLSRLLPRAGQAGVDIVSTLRIAGLEDSRLARYRGRADVVLVDAPCSGTGTLSRSPDLKWRLTPARLAAHVAEQQSILAAASALVKTGGALVYATCSLLQEENREQVKRFTAAGTGIARFLPTHVEDWLPDGGQNSGFFVAKWILQGLQTPAADIIQ